MSAPQNWREIRAEMLTQKGFSYQTFRLVGSMDGARVRKQFKSRAEAEGEKTRLEIELATKEGAVRPLNTRLTPAQLAMW